MKHLICLLMISAFATSAQAVDFVHGFYYTTDHSCGISVAHALQSPEQLVVRMNWAGGSFNLVLNEDVSVNEQNHLLIDKMDQAHHYNLDFLVDSATGKLSSVLAKIDGMDIPCSGQELLLYGPLP